MSKDDILDIFFEMMEDIVGSITLPTGDSLVPTFLFSVMITATAAFSTYKYGFSFFSWKGALLASVLLLGLAIIERRGVNEISRMRTVATAVAANIKGRAEAAGASLKAHKCTNPGDEMYGVDKGPADAAGDWQGCSSLNRAGSEEQGN